MWRARMPIGVAGVFAVVACATAAEPDAIGLGDPCDDDSECEEGLECVAYRCRDTMTDAGASATGEESGASGSQAAGAGAGGASGAGGSPGAAGAGGSPAAGAPGAGGSSTCAPPNHLCGSMCVTASPANGCARSVDCLPCPEPAHSFASCTPGGDCSFSCFSGYVKAGSECVTSGAGGASGAGGTSGTGGTGAAGGTGPGCSGCPSPPTNPMGCASCDCLSYTWPVSWDPVANADRYEVSFFCGTFGVKDVGNKTTADLCVEVGMCSASCPFGGAVASVAACNAMGCSAPVPFTSGVPITCGGGLCC